MAVDESRTGDVSSRNTAAVVSSGALGKAQPHTNTPFRQHGLEGDQPRRDHAEELMNEIARAARQRSNSEAVIVSSIQHRAELFEGAHVQAKQAAIDAVSKDTSPSERTARQSEELRKAEVEVLPPGAIQKLAAQDARGYSKLQDPERQAEAAIAMAETARLSSTYRTALAEKAPEISNAIQLATAALSKDKSPASATQAATIDGSASPTMSLDPAALARVDGTRVQSGASATPQPGLNGIEQVVDQARTSRETTEDDRRTATKRAAGNGPEQNNTAPAGPSNKNKIQSDEVFNATTSDSPPVVPREVEDKYLRVGAKFYHPKNTDVVAFEDKGNKLETRSNSEQVAEAMVAIARARGWDEIKVSGSETFRKEVWLEAAAHGMQVKGYTPSEVDKAELAKRAKDIEPNKIEPKADFRGRENLSDTPEPAKEASSAPQTSYTLRTFQGIGKGHRNEPYPDLESAVAAFIKADDKAIPQVRHDNKTVLEYDPEDRRPTSPRKEIEALHERLSKELERSSEPGATRVPHVDKPRTEQNSALVTENLGNAGRVSAEPTTNHHSPDNQRRAKAFSDKPAHEALREHPELAGTYAMMASIDKKAAADGLDPKQKAMVMDRVRANLVNSIERGELPEVKVREQVEVRRERTEEREVTR